MTDNNAETRAELLERLRTLVTGSGGGPLFPCVEDLVGNGPNIPRLQADGVIPNRQDLTQYCEPHCPVYEAMAGKTLEGELARLKPRPEPTSPVQVLPVKARYRKEFEASLETVRTALAGGEKIADILQRLQEQGMKTRTGRSWTESTLRRELRELGSASNESSSSGHENPAEP